MVPVSAQAPVYSLQETHSPLSCTPQTTIPDQSPIPSHAKHPRVTFHLTLSTIIASLVLTFLIFISGTSRAPFTYSKASHATILLQDYNILDIPIKYPFLCGENQKVWECEARWIIKIYLDAVWAYEDVQGDYEPIHMLLKGVGKMVDLTDALTIMDETLMLEGQAHLNRSYTIPTEPTLSVNEMTPIKTLTPFVLLVFDIALISLVFVV